MSPSGTIWLLKRAVTWRTPLTVPVGENAVMVVCASARSGRPQNAAAPRKRNRERMQAPLLNYYEPSFANAPYKVNLIYCARLNTAIDSTCDVCGNMLTTPALSST